jgi:hypothetical protein
MDYMSIGVRSDTKNMLETLKREQGIKTYDDLLRGLVSRSRSSMIETMFGMEPGIGGFKREKNEFERF